MNRKKSDGKSWLCTSTVLTTVIILSVFTIGIGILPAGAHISSVNRYLPDSVQTSETFTVALTQTGFLEPLNVGVVTETLPVGFEYVEGSYVGGAPEQVTYDPATRTLKVPFKEEYTITYGVKASSYEQTAVFSGTYRALVGDPFFEDGTVGGDAEVVVEEEGADTTPPAAITDLAASNPTSSSIDLTWTAPGDDDNTGTAATYDIRYLAGTTQITDANWAAAIQCTGEPTPQVAGSSETFTVTGLSAGTDYCFAIKTADGVPNWSTISNSPCGTTTTTPDTTPPAQINDLATSNPTSGSIDLTWTAPGDDGDTGTATEYDIRYLEGTTPITDANWDTATECTGEPAPQVAGTTETFTVIGLAAETDYCFAIKTADEVPLWSPISNSPCGATTTELQQFELSLVEGWNLISIPLEPADTSLDAVFPDASDGDVLETYDGGWLIATYYSALPGWWGDFDTIELDKGYWYNANAAHTATIEGTEAGPRSVPIAAGWNLIGYARLTDAGLDDLIPNASDGDVLETYDGGWLIVTYYSALPGWWGDFDTMQPGNGYWYNANAPFTWEY